MKNELKEILGAALGQGGDQSIEEIITIMELPDTQFDSIYPTARQNLEKVFTSSKFQTEALANLQQVSHGTVEEEQDAMNELIEQINADDTLSENKKALLTYIIEGSVIAILKLMEVPRERIPVKIERIHPDAIIPKYAHKTDCGADVFAVEEVTLKPHTTEIIKTGIKIAIPGGYEVQVRPRSGLSLKSPLRIANAPGTIDSDYRGEVGIIMENTGNLSYTIEKGDKIAQLVIAPTPMMEFTEVSELDNTERGEGGFGSTGKA